MEVKHPEENKLSPQSFELAEDSSASSQEKWYEKLFSCRWVMSYVGCLCFTLIYALRINMGIAMVCMVKPAPVSINDTDMISKGTDCLSQPSIGNSSLDKSVVTGDIQWDKILQGWVLSSFFYGYIVTQIPGGYLAGRFGGKRVMLVGMAVYGLSTVLIPVAARFNGKDYITSAYLVISLRVVAGLATGVAFPAMHNLWGKWAPTYERSKLTVLCFSGTMIGNVVMLGAGGIFCEWQEFDGGWPSMFYIGGGLCLLFCVLWCFTVYDSPAEHPRISSRERLYIERNISAKFNKHIYVPWLKMAKSPAMWAIIVSHSCNNFGNYTLVTKLPAFMKEVLKFDIKSNGLYSTLPYIAMFVVANTISQVIDWLRERQRITTTTARKTAMVLAYVVPAGILVGTGHIPCRLNYLGVVCLTLAVGFTGFNRCGYNVNPQDIAPQYAGEIFGISNTFATIPGMVAPLVVNILTPQGLQREWQIVFYIWAGIFCFGALFYSIFGSGELQPWAKSQPRDQIDDTESKSNYSE